MKRSKNVNSPVKHGLDHGQQTYRSSTLIRRFFPYLYKYRGLLALDLFFASMTTLCDIALPMIMRRLTNSALGSADPLTVELVIRLAVLYVVLRLIDAGANFYMQSQGHIMGVYIETDMRRAAFDHLQRLSGTYYSNHKIGQIMGRITNDLFDVTEFAHHCPEEFFIASIKIIVSFIILARTSLLLTVLICSGLEKNIKALLSFVSGDCIGHDYLIGITYMGFA